MGSMMSGMEMMGMGTSLGTALMCLLVLFVLALVAAAAIKYLFFDKSRRKDSRTTAEASTELRRASMLPATGAQPTSQKAD